MMSRFFSYFSLVVVAIFSLSCNKTEEPIEVDFSYGYFPINVGHYVIYDVDSIVYDDFGNPFIDTITYQIREVIESKFKDNGGRTTCRIERYHRDNDTLPWKIVDVWVANLNALSAERVEENLRFIKLIFPPSKGETWNCNSFISAKDDLAWYSGWKSKYREVNVQQTIGEITYAETLNILLVDDDKSFLEYIYSEETWAYNVGMVQKELIHLTRPGSSGDWENGFILTMTAVESGN